MADLAVFVNRSARKRRSSRAVATAIAALHELTAHDARPVVVETASAPQVRQQTAALVASGVKRIVVLGGDGLVHQVIQNLAGTDTTLGIVPIGTGNDFAAALGLPRDPRQATETALGESRPIDLLHSPAGWAVSVATIGFSAAVTERAEQLRRPRGSARYSVATMLQLPHLRSMPLVVHLGGSADQAPGEHHVSAALVAVGNTSMFGGGMRICPDASPTDGLLDVTIVEAVGRLDLLRHFGRVFRGTHIRHPAVSTYRARSITLVAPSTKEAPVRADGESWGHLPLTIEVVPAALQVASTRP